MYGREQRPLRSGPRDGRSGKGRLEAGAAHVLDFVGEREVVGTRKIEHGIGPKAYLQQCACLFQGDADCDSGARPSRRRLRRRAHRRATHGCGQPLLLRAYGDSCEDRPARECMRGRGSEEQAGRSPIYDRHFRGLPGRLPSPRGTEGIRRPSQGARGRRPAESYCRIREVRGAGTILRGRAAALGGSDYSSGMTNPVVRRRRPSPWMVTRAPRGGSRP